MRAEGLMMVIVFYIFLHGIYAHEKPRAAKKHIMY
jgi:hypothetical protein